VGGGGAREKRVSLHAKNARAFLTGGRNAKKPCAAAASQPTMSYGFELGFDDFVDVAAAAASPDGGRARRGADGKRARRLAQAGRSHLLVPDDDDDDDDDDGGDGWNLCGGPGGAYGTPDHYRAMTTRALSEGGVRGHQRKVTLFYLLRERDQEQSRYSYWARARAADSWNPWELAKALMHVWWNRRQRAVHCELAFDHMVGDDVTPLDSEFVLAYSVTYENGVHAKQRNFGNMAYDYVSVPVSEQQERNMLKFLNSQVKLQKRLSPLSHWVPVYPTCPPAHPKDRYPEGFWCSFIIVAALQAAGMCQHVRAHACTVDDVVELFHALASGHRRDELQSAANPRMCKAWKEGIPPQMLEAFMRARAAGALDV